MALLRKNSSIPYRMALAGGWIDQPYISRHNPSPPGSMVVVSLLPTVPFMERAGMATGTRKVAERLWGGALPSGNSLELVKELYREENRDRKAPSGSQDMIGIVFPGVCRLDYDHRSDGGVFPARIESNNEAEVARWLERVVHLLPVSSRPDDYDPLNEIRLEPSWIERLGRTGADCYRSIVSRDLSGLARSFNETMACWEAILPGTLHHRSLDPGLVQRLKHFQSLYPGAMYSGCGGGYLYVVSEETVPGSFKVQVRTH